MQIIFNSELQSQDLKALTKLSTSLSNVGVTYDLEISEASSLQKIANFIATYIMTHHTSEMLHSILKRSFSFSDDKNQTILHKAIQCKEFQSASIKKILSKEIIPFLNEDFLNIPGTLLFRFNEYKSQLHQYLTPVVREIREVEQQEEFISLLRGCYMFQEKKMDTLHIIHNSDGSYTFLDNTHQPIELATEYYQDMDSDNRQEDIILGNIMTHLPETIYLYTEQNEETLNQMMLKVFEDHIYIHTKYPFQITNRG